MAQSKSQADKFREAAREVETDDDERRFNEKLRKLAKTPPVKRKDNDDE